MFNRNKKEINDYIKIPHVDTYNSDISYLFDYRLIGDTFAFILSSIEDEPFILDNIYNKNYNYTVVLPLRKVDIVTNKDLSSSDAILISREILGNCHFILSFKNFACDKYPYLNDFLDDCHNKMLNDGKLTIDDVWDLAHTFVENYDCKVRRK